MRHLSPFPSRLACETPRKLTAAPVRRVIKELFVGIFVLAMFAAPLRAMQPEPSHAVAGEAAHESHEEGRGAIDTIARLVNFAILVGTLVYFLRAPLRAYLNDRGTQIRSDLVNAAEMKQSAAAQIAEIDRKMKALPAELEALRAQGAQEIVLEEQQIRAAAAAERDRLLEQSRREIDLQVKIAERDLVAHAADLAIGVAAERIKKNITEDDQKRLVERYVQQLKG
jgi:F-type H+-transporting ATPase subunit b